MSSTTKSPIRAYSGIQPSGAPHLGNDLGAIRNYVALQENYESKTHAITYLSYDGALRTVARGLREGVWTESMVRVVPA